MQEVVIKAKTQKTKNEAISEQAETQKGTKDSKFEKTIDKIKRVGNKEYRVYISERYVIGRVFTYTMSGFGNGFATEWVIDFDCPNKRYARTEIYCNNYSWACRGHNLTEGWIESKAFTPRKTAKEFRDKILNQIQKENADIETIFQAIVLAVELTMRKEG